MKISIPGSNVSLTLSSTGGATRRPTTYTGETLVVHGRILDALNAEL